MSTSPYSKIVVLTGAGISAESGVATFRDPKGIWAEYDYQDVATPEGFSRDPVKVLEFYNMRRKLHRSVKPNAAHVALARLEAEFQGQVIIITQNVDALHEAAGSHNLIHMHGEILKRLCNACQMRDAWHDDLDTDTKCPSCNTRSSLRPDVVWFGEPPYHMEEIAIHLDAADLFISIGTSGHVYPAAGFVAEARHSGAHTVELNLEPSVGASQFHESIHGQAGTIVPDYVDYLLVAAAR